MGRQNRPGGGVRPARTWTEDDDALNLYLDKFKVSEHIDFEALIDVREFVLKIEDWELPLLTKKNKVHEEKLLYKYEGVKFTDDDEVRACPSPPTLTPPPLPCSRPPTPSTRRPRLHGDRKEQGTPGPRHGRQRRGRR